MMYQLYQANMDLLVPIRLLAQVSAGMMRRAMPWAAEAYGGKHAIAAADLFWHARTTHQRPPFGIATVRVGNAEVAVREEAAQATPFGTLLHFAKDIQAVQPKVLVVAPMSGHFATLLRGTVRTMLADHDVYITDWHNPRDVPLRHGRFGFDEFVDHVVSFMQALGPGSHVVAVCQPAVAVLAAVAVMAARNDPAQPRSMTLMAGPIDTRINPTMVNRLAQERTIGWFEQHLIASVPLRFAGALRRVYPGFLQVGAFMSMNLDRHVRAHLDQYNHVRHGCGDQADAHRAFYDEYLAVMDLPEEFYLETVRKVFQDHDLPLGRLTWHGEPVDPGAIRRTALFTVEGELDDICAIGQTMAALDLCRNLRPALKRHHLQTGAGHYGVFSGRRWQHEIYPQLRQFIQLNA